MNLASNIIAFESPVIGTYIKKYYFPKRRDWYLFLLCLFACIYSIHIYRIKWCIVGQRENFTEWFTLPHLERNSRRFLSHSSFLIVFRTIKKMVIIINTNAKIEWPLDVITVMDPTLLSDHKWTLKKCLYYPIHSIFCASAPPELWTLAIQTPSTLNTKFDIYDPEDYETIQPSPQNIRFAVLTRIFHV